MPYVAMPQDLSEHPTPDLQESPESIKSTPGQDEDPHGSEEEPHIYDEEPQMSEEEPPILEDEAHSPEEEPHASEEEETSQFDHLWTKFMAFSNHQRLARNKSPEDKNKLHPYVQILSITDLDACIALENAAQPEGHRCSREKV
jgi:hypothetical protein